MSGNTAKIILAAGVTAFLTAAVLIAAFLVYLFSYREGRTRPLSSRSRNAPSIAAASGEK